MVTQAGARGGRPAVGGAVWSMEVVVHVPHLKGCRAFVFGPPLAGVAELLGEDPVVALFLPVMPRRVRRDPLMPCAQQGRPGLQAMIFRASRLLSPFGSMDRHG